MHAGNIDAVWLEMTNGDIHYAVDIVYFNHGNAPAGTSYENEILGAPDNDPTVIPISQPTGFTHLGPQFTTIVLCFDTAPKPVDETHEHSDGITHSHEGGNEEHSHEEEGDDNDDDDDDSTLPSMSLVATLGVTMLAAFVSRRKD